MTFGEMLCFDLTYEGLKYKPQQSMGRNIPRFDLTYEGLKSTTNQ